MSETILSIAIGILIIVLGILHIKGNLKLLHSYHIKNVKEEDKIPFGRKIGAGATIIGCAIAISGIAELFLPRIANIIMIVGLIPGVILIFYALLKYNKGLF